MVVGDDVMDSVFLPGVAEPVGDGQRPAAAASFPNPPPHPRQTNTGNATYRSESHNNDALLWYQVLSQSPTRLAPRRRRARKQKSRSLSDDRRPARALVRLRDAVVIGRYIRCEWRS
jgi:hypothetical protein